MFFSRQSVDLLSFSLSPAVLLFSRFVSRRYGGGVSAIGVASGSPGGRDLMSRAASVDTG